MSKNESRISKLEKDQASKAPAATRIPRDPIAFARLLNIEPDPWQCDLLTSTEERIIINCSRQSGKSTIVAILALHHALLILLGRSCHSFAVTAAINESSSGRPAEFYRLLGNRGGSERARLPRSNSKTAAAS